MGFEVFHLNTTIEKDNSGEQRLTSDISVTAIDGKQNLSEGSSKKSILYSDYNAEEEANDGNLGQRSISLTTLPHGGPGSTSTAPTTASGPTLEPRMAQLETLEAKMASIEVSLSTTPRRKNGKKNGNTQLGLITKNSALGSSSAMNILASVRSNTLIDTCRELEVLRNALKDKENTIQNLQGQMNCCGRLTSPQPFDNAERRVAELRLQTLRQEEESRKAAIKRINLTLEQIDESESNIDVRIRQAELEYELGREELGLLGVREEMRALQARLDAKPMPTLYSCVSQSGRSSLHCVQLEYDPKSPRFGAGAMDDKIGLFVLWAAEDSGLQKGDRILEVNGKMTLATSKEEMNRLLTVCPSKAEIVVNRPWSPPPTSEDFLRRENLRLTHRISYLEDQVAELLLQKEKSVPFKPAKYEKKQMEVFQKGSQVTVLQNPQTKSETHLTTVTINSPGSEKPYKSSGEVIVENGCNISVGPSEKYHEVESYHAYPGKGKIKALSKKYEKDEFSSTLSSYNRDCEEEEQQQQQPHKTKLIFPKNSAPAETNYSHSDLDKHSCKSNNFYNRVVDYNSESSSNRYRANASVKSLDLESRRKTENDDREIQENGKPLPPRKPILLSIHRATSLQNVETGYSLHNAIRKIKKTHKSEAPPPPTQESHSVNGEIYRINHSDSSQSPFRWPVHQRSKSKRTEKWC